MSQPLRFKLGASIGAMRVMPFIPKKLILAILYLWAGCSAFQAWAEQPQRILVLPFDIYAAQDLTFLQKGVQDMLVTRLFEKDKIIPYTKEEAASVLESLKRPVNQAGAVQAGAAIGADYVLYGSLTLFGESVSTDAHFFNVKTKQELVAFNQAGQKQGNIISHVDLLARQINADVFKRAVAPTQAPAAAPPATSPAQSKPTAKTSVPTSRQHPEKLVISGTGSTYETGGGPESTSDNTFTVWKSRRFKDEIIGVAVGDVTGDGRQETVFISSHTVSVFRFEDQSFNKISGHTVERALSLLNVDVVDLNDNGRAEIFVTAHLPQSGAQSGRNNSFVLEWNGAKLDPLVSDQNWYFRSMPASTFRGPTLLGQKRGPREQLFKGAVMPLIWKDGALAEDIPLNLPRNLKVLDFTLGDILNSGQETIAKFTRTDKVRVLGPKGSEEWESTTEYGGNPIYIEYSAWVTRKTDFHKRDRYYIPQRILVADLDQNGQNELIVVKNSDATGRTFERFRLFKNGQIECLEWNTLGFDLKWRTQQVGGYISDYNIGDLNNDGRDELVFSVASKTGPIFGKDKSYIVSWTVQ